MSVSKRQRVKAYLTAALVLVLALSLIVFPKETFQASLEGLNLWFGVVLPALLPFFVMAELLIHLGVIQFLGVFLEPVMYPLFRIPGVGAFAVALGLASGYPLGAKLTADLRRERLITQIEAERLVSFANTAGPLFIAGAVAVGMLGLPEMALVLMLAHYISTIMVGFFMRFYGSSQQGGRTCTETVNPPIYGTNALFNARGSTAHIGSLFYDAVMQSLRSLNFIGGCIMIFSVFSRILNLAGLIPALSDFLTSVLPFFDLNQDLASSAISGLLEIDIGIQAVAQAKATLIQKLVVISAIIGWSGLSVHMQVAAMIRGTDIRIKPYIIARVFHAVCAGITTALLYHPVGLIWRQLGLSVLVMAKLSFSQPSMLAILGLSVSMAALIGAIFVLLVLLAYLLNRIVFFWVRK